MSIIRLSEDLQLNYDVPEGRPALYSLLEKAYRTTGTEMLFRSAMDLTA